MAGWRDVLTWAKVSNSQKKMASFRNAFFFVSDTGSTIGRRNVVHQYPFRNDPLIEDLGEDVDEFTIVGYVIQNPENEFNYFTERDALKEALKTEGAGVLIDPFLGTKKVNLVGKAQISESFSPGGIARFTMTFIKVKDLPTPFAQDEDYIAQVDDAKEKSLEDQKDGFDSVYDAEDAPDFSTNTIQDTIDDVNSTLKAVTIGVQGAGPAQVSKALSTLSEAHAGIDIDTIRDSCELANGIIGMFNGLLSLSGQYGDIVVSQLLGSCSGTLRGISSGPFSGAQVEIPETGFMASTISDPGLVSENLGKTIVDASLNTATFANDYEDIDIVTASRAQESANREMVINSIRTNAILVAGSTAIRIDHSSFNAVNSMMEDVVKALDIHLLKLGDDVANTDYATYGLTIANPDEYNALESFRAVFVNSMIGIGANLATVVDYVVPPAVISSLVLSYNLYENLERESEIINRNIPIVKHPGFLPQNETLEILDV